MKRLAGIVLGLVLVATACGSSSKSESAKPEAANKKITLMLDWTPNTNHSGIYLAKQKGYYAQQGLDVNIVQPGDQGALATVGSGQADFGVSVAEELLPARANGVPVVSLAPILSTNTSSLMSLASKNITRPKDLENKTYGGSGGNLERQLVSSLVKCDGGDPSKVKFTDVGNVDYRTALERNQFDFAWVFNGWEVLKLKQAGVKVNTINLSDNFNCIPDWYTPLIATNENMINKDPDTVREFMAATAHGYNDAIADPAAASDALLAGAPELDSSLVKESSQYLSKYYAKPGKPWGDQDPAVWSNFEQFLRKSGLLEKDVDVNRAYTTAFLPHQ